MEYRDFNQLKKNILELLKHGEVSTSSQVAVKMDASLTNVCDCLLRLYRLRLVDRHEIETGAPGRPSYTYMINPRGLDRLAYWQKQGENNT